MGFDISNIPTDLIMNLLNIILLYVIVRTLVYKPVKKFMSERTERVNAKENEAAATVVEVQKLKEQYEQLIPKSEDASKEIIRKGEQKASEEANRIIAEAMKKSEEMIEEARAKTELERAQIIESMKTDVANMSLEICSKILSRNISDEDNRRFAEELFKTESTKKTSFGDF